METFARRWRWISFGLAGLLFVPSVAGWFLPLLVVGGLMFVASALAFMSEWSPRRPTLCVLWIGSLMAGVLFVQVAFGLLEGWSLLGRCCFGVIGSGLLIGLTYLARVVHLLERSAGEDIRALEERCVALEADNASLSGRIDQL